MSGKSRLDQYLAAKRLVTTRSQAESYIKLGQVSVNKKTITKPGFLVSPTDDIQLHAVQQYVSRAALKLASATKNFNIEFKDKIILDVGSSTGGFTDFALKNGARKVIAVDVGTNQLHPSLRDNPKIELHEQTDIRHFKSRQKIDMVLIDVSFISLKQVLPSLARIAGTKTQILAMAKPQFEAINQGQKHHGIIKNNRVRRAIFQNLETWIQNLFIIVKKADSEVAGAKGNIEKFYLLQKLASARL